MVHYFCFAVEPTKDNPKFWDVQAGWAHVFILGNSAELLGEARAMVEAEKWTIQTLQTVVATEESQLHTLPIYTQQQLRQNGRCVEFEAYGTGLGPDQAGNPFS
jgi:hypothetical protein